MENWQKWSRKVLKCTRKFLSKSLKTSFINAYAPFHTEVVNEISYHSVIPYCSRTWVNCVDDWLIEHGLTSPPTQYRLYGRRFTGQKTQPTVSKYWRNTKSTLITQKYYKRPDIQTRKPSYRWQTRATRKPAKNCSNSTYLQRRRWQYWPIFIRLAVVASEICEILRNSLKIQTYGV